ncbi:MAG: ABC transporter substrate-binding protein [Dehalococcoidales bacterium]|nr:ABC transporter substrate-binding protein [Dehalococcoidales bacterium]
MKKTAAILFCLFLSVLQLVPGCSTTEDKSTTSPAVISAQPPVVSQPAAAPKTTILAATTTPPVASDSTSKFGGTFRYIDPRSPSTTLGWWAEPGPPAGLYACTMLEGLISVDFSGESTPLLATSWDIASDLKSVTFNLRKGVKFHDGSEFDAAVAKWNIEQYMAAKISAVNTVDSVEIVDDYTIKLNLIQYTNTLVSNNIAGVYMVSQAAFNKGGVEALRWNPVGTGPFEFDSFEPDVVLKVKRFEDYWDQPKPYLDAIEAHFVQDLLTAEASFEAGEVDCVGGDSAQQLYNLQQKGAQITRVYSGASTLIPDSTNTSSALADLKVRQAIDCAIDREAIVKARGYGFWISTHQFAPPEASAYVEDLPERTYDPEKAKQLLAEAGYPEGFKTTIYGDASTSDKAAAVAIQGFLNDVNIDTELKWLDFAGFVNYVMGGWENGMLYCANGFNAGNLNFGIDFVWSQKAPFFPSVEKTDDLQAMITASLNSKDYDPALVQDVLRYMHDTAMFIPVYCITRGHALQPYVHDTGMDSSLQLLMSWLPANTWLSK